MFSIGQLEDISERKAFSDRLQYEAAHDAMTGLLNRASFTDRVAAALAAEEASGPRALPCCSSTSTTSRSSTTASGTRPATTCSTTVAQRLRHALRPGDLLARFGGDEFVLLCTNIARRPGRVRPSRSG